MVTYGVKLKIWSWRAWLRFFVVSMDLLYHVFIFSAIFSHKVSELNSKSYGNIYYYNADTDFMSETARSQALIQALNKFKNSWTNTYIVIVIRYENGYYFTYIASIQGAGNSFHVLEYSASYPSINIWNVTITLDNATISRHFSDDATILAGESGKWTPVLSAGVKITNGAGYYHKIGKLVYCNVLIWIDSSEATDEDLTISLPFISNHDRSYGTVGYLNPFNFPNLCVGVVGKINIANLIYTNTSGETVSIKGNQISTSIQFTITYVTS